MVEGSLGEKRLLEKLMTLIPGFKGYKEKELRRESDRVLRSFLHQGMEALRARLFEVYREMVEEGMTGLWEGVDRILAVIDRLSERVNHASYGYTGFFDLVKVDEGKLDLMLDHDRRLIQRVEALLEKVKKLEETLKTGGEEEVKGEMRGLSEDLRGFEESLDERKRVILGVLEG